MQGAGRHHQGHGGAIGIGHNVPGQVVQVFRVYLGDHKGHIIYDIGGGIQNGRPFKAVQTGGPSGGCVPADMMDLNVDYESLQQAGTIMGSGGIIVMDEDNCMVDIARSVGAEVLLVTPASNLRHCAPFKSEHRAGLDEQQLRQALRYRYERIVGASGAISEVFRALDKVIPTELPDGMIQRS